MEAREIMDMLSALKKGQAEIMEQLRKRGAKPKAGHVPSLDECNLYYSDCCDKDSTWLSFDVEDFYDANAAKGWVQGKQQKPVKDWQAHMRNWKRCGYCIRKSTPKFKASEYE